MCLKLCLPIVAGKGRCRESVCNSCRHTGGGEGRPRGNVRSSRWFTTVGRENKGGVFVIKLN